MEFVYYSTYFFIVGWKGSWRYRVITSVVTVVRRTLAGPVSTLASLSVLNVLEFIGVLECTYQRWGEIVFVHVVLRMISYEEFTNKSFMIIISCTHRFEA